MSQVFLDCRSDFPALKRTHHGLPLAYFDGPAGTQVPQQVIDAIIHYYSSCNANTRGRFLTSHESDAFLVETRQWVGHYLNAEQEKTISFGANMTSLTFALAHAIGRSLQSGDEIVITQLDHEANRGPWLDLKEKGAILREVHLQPDGTLDYDHFQSVLSDRTRVVAVGYASNCLGTVNQLPLVRKLSREVGALLVVDAVHYAPHFSIDVQSLDADFLLCSAYKFYGPHVGILYSRPGLLEKLQTNRLRTQDEKAPYRIETGTLNHASVVGVKAAIEYIAGLGEGETCRQRIESAMERIAEYEHHLACGLYEGLCQIPGIKVFGPTFKTVHRAPTVSFTVSGRTASQVADHLNEDSILTWDGHFYAIRPLEVLGLNELGGLLRVGMSLYNTEEEVDRLLKSVASL